MFRFARLTYKLLDPDGGQGGAEDTSGSGTDQGGSGSSTGDQTQDSGTKTFTQDEVNTIGAREKSQGKNSILKIFGCADEKLQKQKPKSSRSGRNLRKLKKRKSLKRKRSLKTLLLKVKREPLLQKTSSQLLKQG